MYDPLVDKQITADSHYPKSYWAAGVTEPQYSTLATAAETDVAIIGGGYTGLSCAYHLAQRGVSVALLEANHLGWGCSGRNAGFVLNGSGRLSFSAMQKKWGAETTKAIYREYRAGISQVEQLITEGDIDCERSHSGYLKIAHKPALIDTLKQQAVLMSAEFNDPVQFIDAQTLSEQFLKSDDAHGALHFPYCFGVHPLKLALGFAQLANNSGAALYQHSPVRAWHNQQGDHLLVTPQGQLRAKQVVIATNGYSVNQFHSSIDQRHFPVLSSVIVTEPLTPQQLAACGLQNNILAMDTRELKYYYRLLPDNRLLFGGRGAISGKQANHPNYQQRLHAALLGTFNQLKSVEVSHFWSGWVSVSLDDYPRICQYDADPSVFYSMGYCGSGVSFSSLAGKRLAQRVIGDNALPRLPFYQSPLPRFPLARFRRLGLWGFYHWGRLKDRFL